MTRPSEVLGVPALSLDLSQPAAERYAMIIGNGAYEHATELPNAIADARLVAEILRKSGYVVQSYENLSKRGFEGALRRLLLDASKGAEVVIYYAGHGVQVGSSNRLIPTDADINGIYDIPFETVSLSSIMSIAGSRSRSLIVILDSCRDNPFPGQGAIVGLDSVPQELRTGFAAQDTPVNSLLVFSTSPGARALDGEGSNSPFTEALYEAAVTTPSASLDDLLRDVRRNVYQRTGGLQVPWESSSLVEKVSLNLDPELGEAMGGAGAVAEGTARRGGEIEITMPLEHRIALGSALSGVVGAQSVAVALASEPEQGRLELAEGAKYRGLTLSTLSSNQVGDLVYASNRTENSAVTMTEPRIVDRFDIAANGEVQTVQLTLDVDPCDYHAGDYLDPDGVGVARYPNEIEIVAAREACEAAVQRAPDTGRFHYQLGRVLVAEANLDAAEAAFVRARDLGHTRAWQALGLLEMRRVQATGGSVRTRASDKALANLAMGVDRGDPYAFHTLGLQLLEMQDDPRLKLQGFELLSRALEVGHTFSMNALGLYFLEKDSDHYEPLRGLRYWQESAARGDIYGYANMGYVALNGVGGTEPDPALALDWYRKASDQGHPTAPTSIGRMYYKGAMGGDPDYAQAIVWYDLGLSRGDAWGGANAAWLIANRKPAGFNLGDAAVRAAKAAALRNASAVEAAEKVLAGLPQPALDAGSQVLMTALGEEVPESGTFDAQSQEALERLATKFGLTFPSGSADRVKMLAKIYWTTQKLRVDLY